ncbi:MAG: hypothetical protein M3R44_08220 [Candidatus Eremiobacteraeota bacterium]|nr:hypothetical protein [Candidatus Eremiobacteraeota bacterium]
MIGKYFASKRQLKPFVPNWPLEEVATISAAGATGRVPRYEKATLRPIFGLPVPQRHRGRKGFGEHEGPEQGGTPGKRLQQCGHRGGDRLLADDLRARRDKWVCHVGRIDPRRALHSGICGGRRLRGRLAGSTDRENCR